MIKEILTYPNQCLRLKSRTVLHFDSKIHNILDDMFDTMESRDGVGLAAIQIGIELKILIICPPTDDGKILRENLIEAINPKLIDFDGEQITQEGCLSVPEFFEDIKRFKTVTVEFSDRYGKKYLKKYEDFLAVAWQHELEHLDGKLFIEKLSITRRKRFEKILKKQLKNKKKGNK